MILRETLGPAMPEVVLHDVEFSQAEKLLEAESLDGLLADFGVSSSAVRRSAQRI